MAERICSNSASASSKVLGGVWFFRAIGINIQGRNGLSVVDRTADEIKRDMMVMLKGNEPGLVAYYKFDEGTGQTSADATGDASNAANFVGADKATWPMWAKSDLPGPFTCAP